MSLQGNDIEYIYYLQDEGSPFWAFAIHDGHQLHRALSTYMLLDDSGRLREEDPYTSAFAELPVNKFVCQTSRFQLDINRPKEKSVYTSPDMAWGLEVWKPEMPVHLLENLYRNYDRIYQEINLMIERTIKRHGFFVVFDIHSYNVKRVGPNETVDTRNNPEINLGTKYVHPKWREVIDVFVNSVKDYAADATPVDIRENVKFMGGNVNQFLNKNFGEKGCVLSIEFRKDFMDEWTGQVFPEKVQYYKQVLLKALDGIKGYFADENS